VNSMNCREMYPNLYLIADGELKDPEVQAVNRHLAECADCRKLLVLLEKETKILSEAVRVPLWEPDRLELLEKRFSRDKVNLRLSFWSAIAGEKKWKYATVAVSLALCLFVSWSLLHRPSANSNTSSTIHPQSETPAQTVKVPQAIVSPAQSERIPDANTIRRSSRARLSPQIEWTTAEAATDFYVIPYVLPFGPNDRVRVIRMNVPVSMLADYGLPAYSDKAFYPIQADVMVGDDNIARAIRFVQQWRMPKNQSKTNKKIGGGL
jgi:hypothetical protein